MQHKKINQVSILFGALLTVQPVVGLAKPVATTAHIKIDQFGYLPNATKVAIVANPKKGANAPGNFSPATGSLQYEIRQWSDDKVVWRGALSAWNNGATHVQSGDQGWYLDFSALKTNGRYYVFDTVNQMGSYPFNINNNVYDSVLTQATRAFFYQRLGIAKEKGFVKAGFEDKAAYTQDAQALLYDPVTKNRGGSKTAKDVSGGWMDAGDPNKYVTFAEKPVIQLLESYRHAPSLFRDDLGLPESGNGVPDLLDEVKWELNFIKRMQDATGTNGLLLKVGLDEYGTYSPLSKDTRVRYYLPECTSSTISGASMFAAGAVVFRNVKTQGGYGNDLLDRAKRAWKRASDQTQSFTKFQTTCDDGTLKAGDADKTAQEQLESAFVAAVYLFEATGDAVYQKFIDAQYTKIRPVSNSWWGPYRMPQQVALLRYAGLSNATADVAKAIRTQKAKMNDVMSIDDATAQTDLYRAYLPDSQYDWSHNEVRADVGNLNFDFYIFNVNASEASRYRRLASEHLHYLHGANPLGLVYLSNMYAQGATVSINQLYHAWFDDGTVYDDAKQSKYGPAPGFLVGGPNKNYSGDRAGIAGQPSQKAYLDFNDTGFSINKNYKPWELSEPTIYHQSAYIMLLSRVMATR